MPSVFEVNSTNTAIAFLAWTLAVVALTKTLFGSFPAAELAWWLYQWGAGEREELAHLNWEVQNRAKYDPDVISRSPHANKQNLTTAEHERKRAELQRRARGSLWRRAGRYFASCFACQAFWSTAALFVAARWPDVGVLGTLASCLAYSAASVVVTTFVGAYTKTDESGGQQPQRDRQSGCPGCGG